MRSPIPAILALALAFPALPALASFIPTDPDYNTFEIPDPLNPGQFLSRQWGLQRMNVPEAWRYTQGSLSVKIAVIDTGIVTGTPDLQGQFLTPQNFGGPTAFEGSASDVHGTWVASVINMKMNNGIGGAGVGNFTLQPIRATDSNGVASDAWVEAAIQVAANENCRVITISLGAFSYSAINAAVTAQLAANKAAGKPDFLVFMASGNNYTTTTLGNSSLDDAKDRLSTDNLIMVSGTNEADQRWVVPPTAPATTPTFGSTIGSFVDLAAPAQDIWVANGTFNDPANNNPAYGYAQGTSFASPYAASGAAMIWSVNPTLTALQVENILFNTAYNPDNPTPGTPFWDSTYGWGRVDIGAAVDAASILPGSIVPEPASLTLLAAGA